MEVRALSGQPQFVKLMTSIPTRITSSIKIRRLLPTSNGLESPFHTEQGFHRLYAVEDIILIILMRIMPRRLGPTFIACLTYQSFVSSSLKGLVLLRLPSLRPCNSRLNIPVSATSSDFGHDIWRHFLAVAWRISSNTPVAAICLVFAVT